MLDSGVRTVSLPLSTLGLDVLREADTMEADETLKVKISLVGEAAVGKTSLIRRFVLDEFDDRYISTLGAKVSKKEMLVEDSDTAATVNLVMMIWDIMGEKHIRDLLREAFFTGTQGIIAVCDVTRYSTLRELDNWVQSVYEVVGAVPVVYAVNKADLMDEVLLLFGERDLEESTAAFEAPYFFTSAKTGEKVGEIFATLGEEIVRRQLTRDVVNIGR